MKNGNIQPAAKCIYLLLYDPDDWGIVDMYLCCIAQNGWGLRMYIYAVTQNGQGNKDV